MLPPLHIHSSTLPCLLSPPILWYPSNQTNTMDLIQCFLNLTVPPCAFSFLLMVWPLLTTLRVAHWLISCVWKEDVHGKVVIITGASSGIGEHTAYQYAKKRAILVLVARREELLRAVADRAHQLGAMDVIIVSADVSNEEDCKRFVDETINRYGRLDHLVNNAGVSHSFLFQVAKETTGFKTVMDITFWGNVYPTYYAIPHLKRTRGKIIVNASVSAWLPVPGMSVYNAAKAALLQFYDTLRIELGQSVGITIVTPGVTESEMNLGKLMTDKGDLTVDKKQRDTQVGLSPVAFAEEVAKALVSGALGGQRYVRVPYWYTIFILYRVFAPEILEGVFRLLYVTKMPGSEHPLTKKLADETGAKKLLYPSTIQ